MKTLAIVLLLLSQLLVTPATLRVVTLESLVANYQEYNGREIVIAGVVLAGEGAIMNLPIPTPPGEAEGMYITMLDSLARNPGALEGEFLKYLRERGGATAVLRGRFEGRERPAFGHLGCCRFKFEITQVLSVGEISPRAFITP